jgi:hypothetical protein
MLKSLFVVALLVFVAVMFLARVGRSSMPERANNDPRKNTSADVPFTVDSTARDVSDSDSGGSGGGDGGGD